jgi:subfamily B ATP-binding cassette protein MsbA
MILVLEHGRIAERGSHQQLMEKRGLYYNMYETMSRAAD